MDKKRDFPQVLVVIHRVIHNFSFIKVFSGSLLEKERIKGLYKLCMLVAHNVDSKP